MSEPLKALPNEWVARLFSRFQVIYGNRMLTMWGDVNQDELRRVWSESLCRFVADDLRVALEAMPGAYKAYPPTLPQFVDLCADAKRARASSALKLDGPRTPMPGHIREQLRNFVKAKTVNG